MQNDQSKTKGAAAVEQQRIVKPPSKYQYTPDMSELSGFGGGYEDACRAMVVAGLEWLDAHPNADPQFMGYKNIYGVINEENEDAKQLSAAAVAACDDCTGAMHQAAISHILWIRKNGWERYCKESRERQAAKVALTTTSSPHDCRADNARTRQ